MTLDTHVLAQRVGARLRELRQDAELTQQEVADRMGSHRPIVSRIESGKHLPSLGEVARYAAVLDLDLITVLVCIDDRWHDAAARALSAAEGP
jgi:transcriptional regulator with XRE-family HTH domain